MPGIRKWLPHPVSSLHIVCIDNFKVCAYCWSDWSEFLSIKLPLYNDTAELKSATLYSLGQNQRIMLDVSYSISSVDISKIVIIDADSLVIENHNSSLLLGKDLDAVAAFNQPATDEDGGRTITTLSSTIPFQSWITVFELSVAHVLGIDESKKLVFLNQSFWVCSVDLSEIEIAYGKRDPMVEVSMHFFIPYDWFAGNRDVVCALAKRDIVLTRGGDLAVVRGGLDHVERVCIE
jgi:hypothetical protein